MKSILSKSMEQFLSPENDGLEIAVMDSFIKQLFHFYSDKKKIIISDDESYHEKAMEVYEKNLFDEKQYTKENLNKLEYFKTEKTKMLDRFLEETTIERIQAENNKYSMSYVAFTKINKEKYLELLNKTRRASESIQKLIDKTKIELNNEVGIEINEEKRRNQIKYQEISREHELIKQQAESDLKNKLNELDEKLEFIFRNFFDSDIVSRRIERIHQQKLNFYHFVAADKLPELLEVGMVHESVEEYCLDDKKLLQLLVTGSETLKKHRMIHDDFQLSSMYYKKRTDGIALFTPLHSKDERELIEGIVLKQFMSFPAGKLEIVMIDPQLSAAFYLFERLGGDDYKRIIDTKTWTTTGDIQNAMVRMRERLETVITAYGPTEKAVIEREKREVFRFLAIADFPDNFSHNALKELEVIVKKGPSYGVNILIAADVDKIAHAHPNDKVIIEQIIKNMNKVIRQGDQLIISLTKVEQELPDFMRGKYYLKLDEVPDTVRSESLIDELIAHLEDYKKQAVNMEDIYNKKVEPDKVSADELIIPLGIKGQGNIVNMILGRGGSDTRHHVLIEGSTGAGKSVFLHTLITSAIINYAPDELQLYLMDYKDGVEFKIYSDYDLPSLRLISVQSERMFGLKVFQALVQEMEERLNMFKNILPNDSVPNISSYRSKTGKKIPRKLLIIDEYERLIMEDDEISKECTNFLRLLVKQGRAAGIHVILATQTFNLPEDIKSQMCVRFAFQGSNNILNSDNTGVSQLKDGPEGQAVFNDGKGHKDYNKIFQVAYIENEQHMLLRELEDTKNHCGITEDAKILYTNIEDNPKHPFNLMIKNQVSERMEFNKRYQLFIGESYDLSSKTSIGLNVGKDNNLLIAGQDEQLARRIVTFSILSILYSNLQLKTEGKNEEFINLLDFGDIGNNKVFNDLGMLASEFKEQISYIAVDDENEEILEEQLPKAEHAIRNVYNELQRRLQYGYDERKRIFLFVFGIDRTHMLSNSNPYETEGYEEYGADFNSPKTCIEMLTELVRSGPEKGIHNIFWLEDYEVAEDILGNRFEMNFGSKIAFKMNANYMRLLVKESDSTNLRKNAAVYLGKTKTNRKLRIYDTPRVSWIEKFGEIYRQKCSEE